MDEPMQDICADPIKAGVGETRYVSVEIDTQATDGYDDALLDDVLLDDDAFKQISDIALRARPVSSPEPRYTVPLGEDEPVLDFKFAKPAQRTPLFRPTNPSGDATIAPSRRDSHHPSGIFSGAQEESYSINTTHGARVIAEAKTFSGATIENEAEPVVEAVASQRPALKQKDSNAQYSTNTTRRKQKQGVSFAAGPINYDRQPIQSLKLQQTRQLTSMTPPFPDIQPQTKKRRGTTTARTPRLQSPVFPQEEPHAHQPSTTRSGSVPLIFEEQSPLQESVLQQKEEVSLYTDVDNEPYVGHISEQHRPSSRRGPPFGPELEARAHLPTATSNSDNEQLNLHMPSKVAANQTRRASIYSRDNDRIRRLPAANMPFPEDTYPANPHPDNGQRMHEIGSPMSANRLNRKTNSATVDPCVNLQSKAQISPKFSLEGSNSKDSTNGRGSITPLREGASYSGETIDISSELKSIQTCIEKEKQKLLEQIHEKDAKINEVFKKNEDYKEDINELGRINASLSERFTTMRENADALKERVKSQLEEYHSLGDFVRRNKSQTEDCNQEVENMRTLLAEANNRLDGLQLYQQNSKAGFIEVRVLAMSQMESLKSVREDLDKCKAELRQEREQTVLLQKEVYAQHQERCLKDTIKGLLDGHCLSVTDMLSEAISNTERDSQSRLSDCLRFLESTTGTSPQAPKEVLEMMRLIETLSTSIGERLQSADDGSETLRNAGTEVMEALKARVETLFEIQDSKKELDERISSLQVANARLEAASRWHEERISELQTQLTAKDSELGRCRAESNLKYEWNRAQLDDRQKELDKCQADLTKKEDELRKSQAKIEAGSVAQNELTVLQATYAKTASELTDATNNLRVYQVALAEQGEMASTMRAQITDLEERLGSAEQKVIDVQRELCQFKASASENLKKQRVDAETDRRKSLELEKRSHVQKASNLQRLRVEAEAMVEGLKAESKKFKEDAETKEQRILVLEAEKATLEDRNKEQDERPAQLDQVAEYHSLIDALKSTTFDIAQLETKLKQTEKKAVADSGMVYEIVESVEAIISQHLANVSRLESYERIEAKAQVYCRKSNIPTEPNALDAILEKIAGFESQASVVARSPSQNNGADNRAGASHTSNGQAIFCTPKSVRLQDPKSPEILDSQMACVPSSSPLPKRGVRSIAPQRGPVLSNATLSIRGSFEETTRRFTTKVTRFRESRTTGDSEDARRNSLFDGPEIEDSQGKGGELVRSSSISSLSELNDSEFDEANDCYMLSLDRPENKKGRREETAGGECPTAAPKEADIKQSKVQTKKPLKSCLKQTTPRSNSVDDKSMTNDTVKTPLSDSTSMKPSTGRQVSRSRVASLSTVQDSSKKPPSNNNLIPGGETPRSGSKQSTTSVHFESNVSKSNVRKRTMASVSSGMKSEPPAKQQRLSLPARGFQAVSPFVPESIKRRESSGPSPESQQ